MIGAPRLFEGRVDDAADPSTPRNCIIIVKPLLGSKQQPSTGRPLAMITRWRGRVCTLPSVLNLIYYQRSDDKGVRVVWMLLSPTLSSLVLAYQDSPARSNPVRIFFHVGVALPPTRTNSQSPSIARLCPQLKKPCSLKIQ